MVLAISKSVGMGGINVPVDVFAVQVNLNRIPQAKGGPLAILGTDSKVGPNTIGAISRFQKHHFGWSDGRIDPGKKTHQKLQTILDELPPVPDVGLSGSAQATTNAWPDISAQAPMLERVLSNLPKNDVFAGAATWLAGLSPARLTAIDIALQEATPYPGKVSDMEGHTSNQRDPFDGKIKRIRHGWRRLKEYFDEAQVTVNMNLPEQREGIMCWNKRVQVPGLPQAPGTTAGIHWCGIFDTWVYRRTQARWPNFQHRPLRWMSPLISMPRQVAMENGGKVDIAPGDVAVILKNTHHFLLISPPVSSGKSQVVWTVSANDEYQSILIKPFAVSLILMRYSCDDIFM